MSKLVFGNGLQVLVEVGSVESGLGKVLGRELVNAFGVESSFEMFQSQCIVENGADFVSMISS